MQYTIRYLQSTKTATDALTSQRVTIDGDTDIIDVADLLCRDSTATEYDDLLSKLQQRGLPTEYGDYLVAVYPRLAAGRHKSKVRTNITIDAGVREWAESRSGNLSQYIEGLIRGEMTKEV